MGVGSRQTHGRVERSEEGAAVKDRIQTDGIVVEGDVVARLVRGVMGGDDTAKSGDRSGDIGCHTECLFLEDSEVSLLMRLICYTVEFLYTIPLSPPGSPT